MDKVAISFKDEGGQCGYRAFDQPEEAARHFLRHARHWATFSVWRLGAGSSRPLLVFWFGTREGCLDGLALQRLVVRQRESGAVYLRSQPLWSQDVSQLRALLEQVVAADQLEIVSSDWTCTPLSEDLPDLFSTQA